MGAGEEKGGGGDVGVAEPVAEGVEGVGDNVAKVKGLDGTVEEVGDGAGGGGGGGGGGAADEEEEKRAELGVDVEEGVKELGEKGEREERLGILRGVLGGIRGEEREEAVGDVGEEDVELVELLFLALLHGDDLVAAEAEEGAAAGGHGKGGGALVLRGTHWVWTRSGTFYREQERWKL